MFYIQGATLEASYFLHFRDDVYVKSVIELPTSFGCPVQCKHCASALLTPVRPVLAQDLVRMAFYIIEDNCISRDSRFLLTYSGIGEGAFHRNDLRMASHWIFGQYPQSYFTFTTAGIDPTFIEFCDELAIELPCHYLQVSYLHYDLNKLEVLMPTARKLGFDFRALLTAIRSTKHIQVRINYVVIRDFNDTQEHWERLLESVKGLEDKIVIRISRLNETQASLRYGFNPPNSDTLTLLCDFLSQAGFSAYVFASAMNDNMNCGQLAWKYEK